MSENQIEKNEKMSPESHEVGEDLEDGEITDDDDNDITNNSNIIYKTTNSPGQSLTDKTTPPTHTLGHSDKIGVVDLIQEDSFVPTKHKSQTLEDDHASSIENAIASALKKKGIEPTMPKMAESRNTINKDLESMSGHSQSRGNRRRKRKKQREEREREKELKEKKKGRYDSPESLTQTIPIDDNELDDDEMLNIRGGSPPPKALSIPMLPFKEKYDSGEESCSSYDSYESPGEDVPVMGEANIRRRRRNKKDARKRRDRNNRNREEGKQDKRNRRDSGDEKHRQESKKLEICKFYLMECCAKKDKCSYMHSDFPCKYYYLGMECVYKNSCKFCHGKPLTEQLRGILLKHLEVAPKEILGNFKRISRDMAIAQITKRHEELCKEFGVENTWSSIVNSQTACSNRRVDQAQANHQVQSHSNIPSLLDIVINPPSSLNGNLLANQNSQLKLDKQRKTRWTDSTCSPSSKSSKKNMKEGDTGGRPSYLDLKNLTSILTADHIEKLSAMGIDNLEQVNELTFGQLNEIGLTIAEISEIQLNAMNMLKLGIGKSGQNSTEKSSASTINNEKEEGMDNSNVGERSHTVDVNCSADSNLDENNSNSGVVDYTQYLKDSNLGIDRSDILDDERDESQLVIDDPNMDNDENVQETALLKYNSNLKRNEKNKLDMNTNDSSFDTLFDVNRVSMNPFKSSFENIEENIENSEKNSSQVLDEYTKKFDENPRSRSQTPTRSQSVTPEATSPEEYNSLIVYDRPTMYDYDPQQCANTDISRSLTMKSDKDMRCLPCNSADGLSDIDLRLPFQPVTNYTPATEIDGSITSHLPMSYKVYVVDVPIPSYVELRKNFKSDQTNDPRLRRILGLPELLASQTTDKLKSSSRKSSTNIASPESDGDSPKYYIPPNNNKSSSTAQPQKSTESKLAKPQVRIDPRRATTELIQNSETAGNSSLGISNTNSSLGAIKQNVEIRNLLQKSDWYKNLTSKFKIMVNQQLALVSTELKKFHQNKSPNKIFDFSFILNNSTLQQILSNLGIYIDDNGDVAYVDSDSEENILKSTGQSGQSVIDSNRKAHITLPNLSLPPPAPQQLDFLRAPPPNLGAHVSSGVNQQLFRAGVTGSLNLPAFCPISNVRPSLLGLPPGASPSFSPFNGAPNFIGVQNGPGIMGPAPITFNNFGNPTGIQQNVQQRNFNSGNQNRNHRNQQNRRSNKI